MFPWGVVKQQNFQQPGCCQQGGLLNRLIRMERNGKQLETRVGVESSGAEFIFPATFAEADSEAELVL
jgi:hypothetical protein